MSRFERVFETQQWIPRPLAEVFSFFADAHNLERITPPQLKFRVLGMSTPEIGAGTLIYYRLSLHGVPFGWKTLIESWEPGKSFVDTQLKGPYKLWHHTHTFVEKDGGTLMTDRVRFELPFAWATGWFVGGFVRREVEGIFAYRRKVIEETFGKA
jgi:uncharacterized protein